MTRFLFASDDVIIRGRDWTVLAFLCSAAIVLCCMAAGLLAFGLLMWGLDYVIEHFAYQVLMAGAAVLAGCAIAGMWPHKVVAKESVRFHNHGDGGWHQACPMCLEEWP